jgi:hypothetical protein
MPKPENIEPFKMKKGQTLNPNGRPRKTISAVNVELEASGATEATKQDITSCYLRLIQLSIPELEAKIKDSQQPALVRIVGKAILSGKGFDVIEKVLDRGIGKPAGSMELTGKNGEPLMPTKVKIEFGEPDNE